MLNDWHIIFDNMTKDAAERCLEEFEASGCVIVNVQCLGKTEPSVTEKKYKWMFVLKEPIKEKPKSEILLEHPEFEPVNVLKN